MYSPSYLFRGTRPVISVAPSIVQYGNVVNVRTSNPAAAPVTRATMIRLSSVTHSFNMNQRFNELPIAAVTGSPGHYNLTTPPSSGVCPPGHYLLFLLTADGVPSEGKVVQILPSACVDPLTFSLTYSGSNCGKVASATVNQHPSVSSDYRWEIDGVAAPQFDNQPTATASLDRCNPSAYFQVTATSLCSGTRVNFNSTASYSFPNGCICGPLPRPAARP